MQAFASQLGIAGSDLALEGAGLALEVLEIGPAGQAEGGHDGLLSTMRLLSAMVRLEGVPCGVLPCCVAQVGSALSADRLRPARRSRVPPSRAHSAT